MIVALMKVVVLLVIGDERRAGFEPQAVVRRMAKRGRIRMERGNMLWYALLKVWDGRDG